MSVGGVARQMRARPEGYAGIVTRAVAFVLDSLLVNVIALVVGACVQLLISLFTGHTDLGPAAALFTGLGWFVWAAVYFVVFWDVTGETPGNRVLGIRVTSADGGQVRLWQAIRRYFGLLLALLPVGLGFVPVLFDHRRRGLHDWIAGTVVRWVGPLEPVPVVPVTETEPLAERAPARRAAPLRAALRSRDS